MTANGPSSKFSHLVDVDRHWLHEALAIRDDTDHVFVHFDDERWKADHPDAREESLESVPASPAESHAAVIAALEGMSEGDLNRAGHHPTRGHPYTAADVFERYVAHDANHAAQIAAAGGLNRRRSGTLWACRSTSTAVPTAAN